MAGKPKMIDKPEFLYHYTSRESFLEIIKDGEGLIWATDILYLNDSKEFTHTIQLASEVFEDHFSDQEELLRDGVEELEKLGRGLAWARNYSIYVVSFSKEGDLLSQWRAYCPETGGLSLAFEENALKEVSASSGFHLIECKYKRDDQKDIIRDIFEKALREPDKNAVTEFLVKELIIRAPTFKHFSFAEEKEWRLVSDLIPLDDKKVKYRLGKSIIIPYLELKLRLKDKLGIYHVLDHVILGPTPFSELAWLSVHRYLKMLHNEKKIRTLDDYDRHVPVFAKKSVVPFRSW